MLPDGQTDKHKIFEDVVFTVYAEHVKSQFFSAVHFVG
jgi:hypothetical protein